MRASEYACVWEQQQTCPSSVSVSTKQQQVVCLCVFVYPAAVAAAVCAAAAAPSGLYLLLLLLGSPLALALADPIPPRAVLLRPCVCGGNSTVACCRVYLLLGSPLPLALADPIPHRAVLTCVSAASTWHMAQLQVRVQQLAATALQPGRKGFRGLNVQGCVGFWPHALSRVLAVCLV